MPLLQTENLIKRFGGLVAVNNVNLVMEKGESVGLIGPNGAGKTTLINLITGFLKPDMGRILFNGKDITGWKPFVINNIGIARTFQIVRPFRHLSVIDNVMVALSSRKGIKNIKKDLQNIANEILKVVGLYDLRSEMAGNLSHGNLKLLEIARALATDPKLLLLDEPFSGLNEAEIMSLSKTITDLHLKGLSMLIVEHKLEYLFRIVDRVVVLHYGQKIAEGKPYQIVKDKEVLKAYVGEE
jgi:branched-chain amino acid transport system ATP-binding protein